jgi:hypothetical protein
MPRRLFERHHVVGRFNRLPVIELAAVEEE